MFQQRYVKRHEIWHKPDIYNEIRLFAAPKIRPSSGLQFWGPDSDRILELSPENRIRSSSLICCQDTTEPFAIASNSISRSFAARGAVQSCSDAEDAMDNVRGLTPHACSTCAISTEFTKELERNIERKTPPISKDEFDLYYKGSIK